MPSVASLIDEADEIARMTYSLMQRVQSETRFET
jgi:hypothetical protein